MDELTFGSWFSRHRLGMSQTRRVTVCAVFGARATWRRVLVQHAAHALIATRPAAYGLRGES